MLSELLLYRKQHACSHILFIVWRESGRLNHIERAIEQFQFAATSSEATKTEFLLLASVLDRHSHSSTRDAYEVHCDSVVLPASMTGVVLCSKWCALIRNAGIRTSHLVTYSNRRGGIWEPHWKHIGLIWICPILSHWKIPVAVYSGEWSSWTQPAHAPTPIWGLCCSTILRNGSLDQMSFLQTHFSGLLSSLLLILQLPTSTWELHIRCATLEKDSLKTSFGYTTLHFSFTEQSNNARLKSVRWFSISSLLQSAALATTFSQVEQQFEKAQLNYRTAVIVDETQLMVVTKTVW